LFPLGCGCHRLCMWRVVPDPWRWRESSRRPGGLFTFS